MKTYHLRFTANDFTKPSNLNVAGTGNYVWRTPVYDLYDNPQYKNYSVKRADYGKDILGTGVYTGLSSVNNMGVDAVKFNGTNFMITPNSAALAIAGDIEVVARIKPSNWVSAGNFTGKYNIGANQKSWYFTINAAALEFNWTTNGFSNFTKASTSAPPFSTGQTGWVKVTLDVDNGASGHTAKFYTAPDQETEPTTWTQLGTPVTSAGVTSVFIGTDSMGVGAASVPSGAGFYNGDVYRVILRNGIGGTTAVDFNSHDALVPTNFFTSSTTGEVWTKGTQGSLLPVYTTRIVSISSEVGYAIANRFIDTSSRVDLVDWKVNFDSTIDLEVDSTLSVYTTESLSATPNYGNNWTKQENILSGRNIFNIDSLRYAYFELHFTVDPALDITGKTVELLISIDIDAPIVNGYFPATRRLQDKFPAWMALREYDPEDIFSATPATPSSIGGQFLNAAAGEWLTDLTSKIGYQEFQFHIDTADINQKAWAYVVEGVDPLIWSITGDGVALAHTSDLEEFYTSIDSDYAFFWNRSTNEIYTNQLFTALLINGIKVYQRPYHMWNAFDDIGATVDLFRIQSATPTGYMESNESFKSRILDVYINKPGVDKTSFQKTLRREFNLWKYWNATPNSDYLGATPELYEISDLENDPAYFVNGIPTQNFKDLVQELSIKYPMTWGFFDYEKAFWDADGVTSHKGFSYLPKQLDATPVAEKYLESGIGDSNDIFLFKPKELSGPLNFTTRLKVRGRQKSTRSEFIPLTFGVKVYGTAAEDLWTNPIVTGYFTIELTVVDNSATPASPNQKILYSNIVVSARNDTDFYQATPSAGARAFFEWTTTDGFTDIAYPFLNQVTGEWVGRVDLSTVTAVRIKLGRFNGNFATPIYTDQISQSNFKLWFDGEPNTFIGIGGGTTLSKLGYNYANHFGAFWFESRAVAHTGATPNTWRSDDYSYTVTLNGTQPNMGIQNYTLTMPTITWPASTSVRSYVVEITTANGANNYGAFSDATSATPIFVSSSYITANGDNVWSGGFRKTFSSATTAVTLATSSSNTHNSLVLPGSAGNYVTTPDAPIVDITGDIEFVAFINPTSWASGSNRQIVSKYGASSWSWRFYITSTGGLAFGWSPDGSNSLNIFSSTIPVANGTALWVKATLDSNNGSGDGIVTFYTAPSQQGEPTVWTRLGNPLSTSGIVNIFSGTSNVEVGSYFGNALDFFSGSIYRIIVRNGIDGTVALDMNPDEAAVGTPASWVSSATGVTFSRLGTASIAATTVVGPSYPITASVWSPYEKSINVPISGTVDSNGPWRNGIPSAQGNTNYILSTTNLSRSSFGIPETTSFILTWIGVESVSNNDVICWMEGNTIKPAVKDAGEINVNTTYPDGAILETLTGGAYSFSSFNLFARIKPGVNQKWNPKAHSGWFYDDVDEYYMYASPNTETTTASSYVLRDVNRQGAPLIVKAIAGSTPSRDMRQVAFWNSSASPATLTVSNSEVKTGNGTRTINVAYKDIYNITATNVTTGTNVTLSSTSSTTNTVTFTTATNSAFEYKITYTPRYSFYVDNTFVDANGANRTKLVFDSTPSGISANSYRIDYETSIYDPATPIDISLNTNYTSIDEGFIFIDHDIHALSQVEVTVSPTKIVADGFDYLMITVKSYDVYGNPKPYQFFNLYTNFGRLLNTSVTTDADGFAYTTLLSNNLTPSTPAFPATPALTAATPGGTTQGLILLDGTVDTRVAFEIQAPYQSQNKIVAVLDSDYIFANGASGTYIFGKVETSLHAPVPFAFVYWKKARNLYELFRQGLNNSAATPGSSVTSGRVVADANGRFSIGPFISSLDVGYWLASVESSSASPTGNFTPVGDIVYWYEYPIITNSIDPVTRLPVMAIQASTPYWTIPTSTLGSAFPTTYDEAKPQAGFNSNVINWSPPSWYAVDKYKQYQMGLYSNQYGVIGATPKFPEYKDL